MSVLEIQIAPAAKQRLEMVENYCSNRKIPMVPMRIECTASAIQDQIATVKNILMSIATDDDISDDTKETLNNFLMQISLQMKRVNQGSMQRTTEVTASRVVPGQVMKGLTGVKSTVVPKAGELKAGSVHFTDGGDIEIVIDDCLKVG